MFYVIRYMSFAQYTILIFTIVAKREMPKEKLFKSFLKL